MFGSPRGALRAAVDLQRRCADELRADPSVPLRVGVGIDAGEAVAVAAGYRGGALNLAARLCSIAGPGDVLVSEGVVHLARHVDGMSYVDRGRVELKGMDEPVHVMQLRFELDMPEAASVAVRRWTRERVAALAAGIIVVVALVVVAAVRIGGGHAPVSLADECRRVRGCVGPHPRPGATGRTPRRRGRRGRLGVGDRHRARLGRRDRSGGPEGGHNPRRRRPDRRGSGRGRRMGRRQRQRDGVVDQLRRAPRSVATPIAVGQGPGAIAYGDGAAWVVNATDGTLQRIDRQAQAVGWPIAIGGAPAAVTVGGGWVWVTDTSSSSVV